MRAEFRAILRLPGTAIENRQHLASAGTGMAKHNKMQSARREKQGIHLDSCTPESKFFSLLLERTVAPQENMHLLSIFFSFTSDG